MPSSLARLLKVRRLLEESSRLELESRVAVAFQIERAQEREKMSIQESRKQVLVTVLNESDPVYERACRRKMELANVEIATARHKRLEPVLEAARSRVSEARAQFLELRTLRGQVESVVASEEARQRTEQERRVQRDLDDWFSSKLLRQMRNLPRNESHS